MANTPPQDDRFYKPATLMKWFGILSVAMFTVTLWMLMDDFGRDWKGYQREFFELRQKKYDELIAAAKQGIDENQLKALQDKVAEAIKNTQAREKDTEKLRKELVQLKTKEKIATVKFQAEKGVWDVEKYEHEAKYGHYEAAGHAEKIGVKGQKSLEKLLKHLEEVMKYRSAANAWSQQVEDKQKEIDAQLADKVAAEKELKLARAELDRLQDAKASTELTLTKMLRSAPVVDMANPTFRLQQTVLPTIRDDIFFSRVQKVDRCTTCHMAIDLPGFEKEKQPFRTHPRLDLMLGSRSPHPIDQVGCTVCHEGRGQATEFTRTAHTPRHEEQAKEWKKKYGWHEMHYVIEKMIPLQYTEGKCRVCHKGTEYVPKAEKLTAAYQTIKAAGCYGCHRIEGWDHLRKPAPSLTRMKGKLSRDWIVKWVRDPKSFNEYARMPAAFHQSNIRTEQHRQFQEAEIHAITDYLLSLSDGYSPNVHLGLGNAAKGKEVFGTVGCLGCHQVDDFGRERGRYVQAPDLSTVGSKVSKDWLVSWLKNPRHYWAETTMPSFRLTDGEVSDVAAYLMSKKNPDFESLAPGEADIEAQKQTLRQYLIRDPKLAPVTEEKVNDFIAKLQPHEVTQSLGKNAVMRYGCFGCHEIKGFETTQGIGAELTEWGSKPVNKLDFGLLHHQVAHTNVAWFKQKLADTRSYDRGIVKEYLDLLRMPKYEFNDTEVDLLTTAILGFTSQKIDPPSAKVLSAWESHFEDTSRLVHKYNCQGCHVVEEIWSPMPDDHPGKEEHDKLRLRTEGRILAYYSEDETMGPPPLVTEGARVKTPWAHSFLKDPGSMKLRDKLKVRMPTFQFTNAELNTIVTGWAAQGKVEFPILSETHSGLTSSEIATASKMFNQLQCQNCHTVNRKPTVEEMEGGSKGLAPDLALSYRRLHRDWIVNLLKDPQKMVPGTRMPGFWPENTTALPDILGGDAEAQVQLLAKYVQYLGQGRGAVVQGTAAQPTSSAPTKNRRAE